MTRLRQMQASGADVATATTGNLAEPYYQQVTEDFCGAATTVMISDYLGFGWTGHSSSYQQDQAGYWIKTDGAYKNSSGTIIFPNTSGTAWYGVDNVPSYPYGSYYPIADWLNKELAADRRPVVPAGPAARLPVVVGPDLLLERAGPRRGQ